MIEKPGYLRYFEICNRRLRNFQAQLIAFHWKLRYLFYEEVKQMLSEKIYSLRRKSGLSQEQLAEKIGVSRQAVSKWEGGLSTPELEKLKALSDYFQITIDELTENQAVSASNGAAEEERNPAPRKTGESKLGICLCVTGAVCLILFGVLAVMRPSSVDQISESSVITFNGAGILIASFLLLMISGIIMILKKK